MSPSPKSRTRGPEPTPAGAPAAWVLNESYAFCERVARREARNFYYSFLLLPPEQRRAMCAIYAFMRYCDDLSDGEGVADRATAIARWRDDLEAALAGRAPEHVLWPAFTDAVVRYRIPHQYFFDMIEGVSSDLEPRSLGTFAELYAYCYHVASVVGLTIIHIFGFESPDALKLAEKCGIAFQLTNILRDVREDAEKQRIYLPREDLDRFGVKPDELRAPQISNALRDLLAFEARRARQYYEEAAPLTGMIHPRSRPSLRALIGIYSRLLDRIAASGYRVTERRIRVPAREKIWILLRSRWAGHP
jgi:15-cis-phytoene synthase